MAKPTLKPDDPAQSKRFLKMAAELEADSTPAEFDRAFRKVAAAPRTPKPPKRTKRPTKR